MEIRKAKKENLKEISILYKKIFSEKPYNEKWNNKNLMDKIVEMFKNQRVYVATIDNKIVGFISFYNFMGNKGRIGCIFELGVSKESRNKKVGKILVKRAEEELKKRGCKSVLLDVNKKAPAINFYKKLRYVNIGGYIKMGRKLK